MTERRTVGERRPTIEVLTSPGCPHGEATLALARDVASALTGRDGVTHLEIGSEEEARSASFPGSPTVRIDGMDVDPGADGVGLACRIYDGDGVPPRWRIEAALLAALRPSDVLFLCVANSARSQMAEGLARSMAPEGVRVRSAGSEPTEVRPFAIRALEEVGIDISRNRSKGVEEIDGDVDAVVTLCAEEACPVWLQPAVRVHWALPDPAAHGEAEQLQAFRAVRDELTRRFEVLFRRPDGR